LSVFVISVTGGIASGKSALTEYLKPAAAAIIDADLVAHEIIAPDGPAFGSVVDRFGPGILTASGEIDRSVLADVVFADRRALADLNNLTHPIIAGVIKARLDELGRDLPAAALVILRAPLLLEAGLADAGDLNVVVTAPAETRVERIVEFRGGNAVDARQRVAAQMPDEERVKYADIVVTNTADRSALAQAAENILAAARRAQEERMS
jgi:dephospho-CoA kinase